MQNSLNLLKTDVIQWFISVYGANNAPGVKNSSSPHRPDKSLAFFNNPGGSKETPEAPCPDRCSEEPTAFVCGSDGKTYVNKCKMNVANCKDKSKTITWHLEGTCQSQPGYKAGKPPHLWKEDQQPNLTLSDVNN